MKRVISSRLEDVERQEQEYEAKVAPLRQKADEQQTNYRKAARDIKDRIEMTILKAIGDTTLELEVRVEQGWGRNEGEYEASVKANDRDHFNKDRALSWNYDVKLRDGQLLYDSGSWSGLRATTPEQIADLEESVRVLKKLQTIPWGTILKTDPEELKYDKFVDPENSEQLRELERSKPDFAELKKAAQIEDIIGTNKVVYVINLPDDNYWHGQFTGYLQIVSETPNSYNVRFIDAYDVQRASDNTSENQEAYRSRLSSRLQSGYTTRKLKKNVLRSMKTPIDIVDLDFIL